MVHLRLDFAQAQTLSLKQQEQQLLQGLSADQRRRWDHWNGRMDDPNLAMLSCLYRTHRKSITPAQSRQNNKDFSGWLNSYADWEVEDIRRQCYLTSSGTPVYHPESTGPLAVEIGVGVGLGLSWIKSALEAGMHPKVCDWLNKSLDNGRRALKKIFDKANYPKDRVFVLGEAKAYISHLLPHERVRILKIARVIGHMGETDAQETYRALGKIVAYPENRIIVVDALACCENDMVETETYSYRDEGAVVDWVSEGAGREVGIYRKRTHRDVTNAVFTALTLRAKQ